MKQMNLRQLDVEYRAQEVISMERVLAYWLAALAVVGAVVYWRLF
jgi:hypothetical protein